MKAKEIIIQRKRTGMCFDFSVVATAQSTQGSKEA